MNEKCRTMGERQVLAKLEELCAELNDLKLGERLYGAAKLVMESLDAQYGIDHDKAERVTLTFYRMIEFLHRSEFNPALNESNTGILLALDMIGRFSRELREGRKSK